MTAIGRQSLKLSLVIIVSLQDNNIVLNDEMELEIREWLGWTRGHPEPGVEFFSFDF